MEKASPVGEAFLWWQDSIAQLPDLILDEPPRGACQLITAHIDEDEFCRYVIQRDINGIALALRETHKDDFFSVPEDNPLKEMLETAGEIVSQDSDTEQAYLAFICKRLKLNFRKLSVEERKWLKKIAEKSDLLKNPKPQRGRR